MFAGALWQGAGGVCCVLAGGGQVSPQEEQAAVLFDQVDACAYG